MSARREKSPVATRSPFADRLQLTIDRWAAWLRVAGVDESLARKGPVFEDMNVVLQAAIEGEGMALTSLTMVKADLVAQRLVRPFDLELEVELLGEWSGGC